MKSLFAAAVFTAASLTAYSTAPALAEQKPAPEGAATYIVIPVDGMTVSNPVTVLFGLAGMGVAPAGTAQDSTGHHHLLIDIDPAELDLTEPLPADDHIQHFGGGQTETVLELEPGAHTLYLMLADENHLPFDPPILSQPVHITVQ